MRVFLCRKVPTVNSNARNNGYYCRKQYCAGCHVLNEANARFKLRMDEVADLFHSGVKNFGNQHRKAGSDDEKCVTAVQFQHEDQECIDRQAGGMDPEIAFSLEDEQ